MGFKKIKVQEELAPNLVPMIDIMFLLLLFFMLNADMSARDLEEIKPAIANAATEDKEDGQDADRITVNIHHDSAQNETCPLFSTEQVCRNDAHWRITMQGRSYEFSIDGMKRLSQDLTELANTRRANRNDPSERKVLIRADKFAPYGLIQKAYEQCALAGLYKLEVGVWKPKSEANK